MISQLQYIIFHRHDDVVIMMNNMLRNDSFTVRGTSGCAAKIHSSRYDESCLMTKLTFRHTRSHGSGRWYTTGCDIDHLIDQLSTWPLLMS